MEINSEILIKEPSFREKHSAALRIWHWSSLLVILGSLVTVFFAKVIFNTKDATKVVQDNLQKSNVTATADQAKSVAHEFNDIIWHWHTCIGYVLAALFGFRILLEFFQPGDQKVKRVIKNALKYLRQPAIDKANTTHYVIVKAGYLLFYFALLVQVCTGLFMAYSDGMANLKDLRHTMKNIHSVFMWVIVVYIVLHITGTIIAEQTKKQKGLVSDMINGGERE